MDEVELTADSDRRSYSTQRQDKYEWRTTHRTNTAQRAHNSWKLWEMPGSLMIKQRSPKPKGQLAPTAGGQWKAQQLSQHKMRELQLFEKRKTTRALRVRWESYKPRLHGRPGLDTALFNLAPAQFSSMSWPKANLLGRIQPGTWIPDLKIPSWITFHDDLDVTKMLTDHQAKTPPHIFTTKRTPKQRKNFCSHFINSGDKRLCHTVKHEK